jgi:hypothetical protein
MTDYNVRLVQARAQIEELRVIADGNRHQHAGHGRRGEQQAGLEAVDGGNAVWWGRRAVGTWFIRVGQAVGGRAIAARRTAMHRGGEPCSC